MPVPAPHDLDALQRTLAARLRFKHLQLMVALDRSGSLRTAARELHLTQSALSKSLREIESAFGTRLFERTQNGLKPTDPGVIVIRGARVLLGELAHVGHETAASAGRAVAILRLGILPFMASWLGPKIAARLQQRRLMLRLREERVPRLLSELLAGELDALVTTYTVETESAPETESLTFEILFEESFCVIAPRARKVAARKALGWKDLLQDDWILPARFTFLRRQVDEAFLREGLQPPVPQVESSNAATNVSLVKAGIGTSAVPRLVLDEGSLAAVRVLPVQPALESTRIALVHRAGMEQHPRVALLRDALAAIFAAQPTS